MDDTSLAPIVSKRLSTLIGDRLREFIVQNRCRPGDRLPTEDTLAQRLGVSRGAVREALHGLEAVGLVEARQGFGWVVCEFSFKPILKNLSYGLSFRSVEVLQLVAIRKALDFHFLEPAMRNLTDDDIATLSAITARMRECDAAHLPLTEHDYQFHKLLYERSDNPLALDLFEIYWAVLRAAEGFERVYRDDPPGMAQEHADILDAIKQREVPMARALLLHHYRGVEHRFGTLSAAEPGVTREGYAMHSATSWCREQGGDAYQPTT